MEEHDFTEQFLQARLDDLETLGGSRTPPRTVEEIRGLLRHGLSGGEFVREPGQTLANSDGQLYADALELLGNALVYRESVGALLDALDEFVGGVGG